MIKPLTERVNADTDTASEPAIAILSNTEEQLATIIASARNVAVVAEELLRDISQRGADAHGSGLMPHAIGMAPRLLAATEQQLQSVLAMLKRA